METPIEQVVNMIYTIMRLRPLANKIDDDNEELPLPLPPPLTHRKRGINPSFVVGERRELPPPSSLPPPTAKEGTHPL